MKCSKLICVIKEGDHDDTLCPMPRCLPAKDGCQYVENDEKKKNGCPKHPCGKLVCKEEDDHEEDDHEEEHEDDHEEEHEVDKCVVMKCAYGCANGKCNDKPQEEQEVDDDLPCKNIMCALALCQPGQTTIPANPSEGKCCNSCEDEADVSEPNVEEEDYKIVDGNVYCLAPSKDDYIDHQHAEDVTDHHDGEDDYIDHHDGGYGEDQHMAEFHQYRRL